MGNTQDLVKLTKIPIANNIRCIVNMSSGCDHTVIVNTKNEIYGCGCNEHGELGLGHNEN